MRYSCRKGPRHAVEEHQGRRHAPGQEQGDKNGEQEEHGEKDRRGPHVVVDVLREVGLRTTSAISQQVFN